VFRADLAKAGRYEVRLVYASNKNRASNVPVTVRHVGGEARVTVDQREPGKIDGIAVSLGEFEFAAGPAEVRVSNAGTDGYVIIDAVQWLAK
jgi:hypothetical protein